MGSFTTFEIRKFDDVDPYESKAKKQKFKKWKITMDINDEPVHVAYIYSPTIEEAHHQATIWFKFLNKDNVEIKICEAPKNKKKSRKTNFSLEY